MPLNDDETSRRSGVLKFFSNFLPNSENDFIPLKSPFNEDEHLQLSGKYIVNHRELSSIIAHALSMSEYEQRLNEEFSLTNENNQEQYHEIKQQDDDNDTLPLMIINILNYFFMIQQQNLLLKFSMQRNFIFYVKLFFLIMIKPHIYVHYHVVKNGNHEVENLNQNFGKHLMIILF